MRGNDSMPAHRRSSVEVAAVLLSPADEHVAADDTRPARCGREGLRLPPAPRWATRRLGEEPASSGGTQESCFGLAAGMPLRVDHAR